MMFGSLLIFLTCAYFGQSTKFQFHPGVQKFQGSLNLAPKIENGVLKRTGRIDLSLFTKDSLDQSTDDLFQPSEDLKTPQLDLKTSQIDLKTPQIDFEQPQDDFEQPQDETFFNQTLESPEYFDFTLDNLDQTTQEPDNVTSLILILDQTTQEPDNTSKEEADFVFDQIENTVVRQQTFGRNSEQITFGTSDKHFESDNCTKIVELVEEVDYNETMICKETIGLECYSTYHTTLDIIRIDVCDDSFEKKCRFEYEDRQRTISVNVCNNVPKMNCTAIEDGEPPCNTTISETVCEKFHTVVTETIPRCEQVINEVCDTSSGFCSKVATTKCDFVTQNVTKFSSPNITVRI
jgi:hypothetical protein